MFFRQILHEEKSCLSYLIGCKSYGVVAVVDPQGEADNYLRQAEQHGLKIMAVIDTHIHADHDSVARALAEQIGAPLYLGPGAAVSFPHQSLQDGQVITVGNRKITALHTPGHTPEHVCLYFDNWFVVTGDTLFVGDVGRVDLSLEGTSESYVRENARVLHQSLQRLISLPEFTEIYPGHYSGSVCGRGMDGKPISTIGRERRKNRALSLPLEEFIQYQLTSTPPLPDNFSVIKLHNGGTRAR